MAAVFGHIVKKKLMEYSDEKPVRTFLALPIPARIASSIQPAHANFAHVTEKMVPVENWHVTIAWLGETPNPRQYVSRIRKPVPQPFTPAIRLIYLGRGRKRNQLWVYVEKNQVLENIRTEMIKRLKKVRFPIPEETLKNEFVPHIHVGDFYPSAGGVGLADVPLTTNFSAQEVVWYQSQRTLEGTHYEPICQIPLV